MQYNVFLSGGGLKGAYQYGFFKRLYLVCPNFEINHIYASSVGAVNAAPILVKKVDVLTEFWENSQNKHPFETFVKDWYDFKAYPYKLISHAIQFKAVYKGINREPFDDFWKLLDFADLYNIRNRLTIITYDTVEKKPIFLTKYHTAKDLFASVAASTRHPYLFKQYRLADGHMVSFEEVEKYAAGNDAQDWLIIDLGGKEYNRTTYPNVYGPDVLEYTSVDAFNMDTKKIKRIIEQGEKDAMDFYTKITTKW